MDDGGARFQSQSRVILFPENAFRAQNMPLAMIFFFNTRTPRTRRLKSITPESQVRRKSEPGSATGILSYVKLARKLR